MVPVYLVSASALVLDMDTRSFPDKTQAREWSAAMGHVSHPWASVPFGHCLCWLCFTAFYATPATKGQIRMTDAPERIWALPDCFSNADQDNTEDWTCGDWDTTDNPRSVEYIRADLADRQTQEAAVHDMADKIERQDRLLEDMDDLIAEQARLLKLADDLAECTTAEDEYALAAVVAYRIAREKLK